MPRDAFSNYVLPAGNPVVTGTVVASSWANTTLNDIAVALTQSLSTDGSTATVSLANKTLNNGTFGFFALNTGTIINATIGTGSTFNGGAVTTTALTVSGTSTMQTVNTTALNVNGLLSLASGQILFPATQIPSANLNTLDDYREGTWLPTFTAPGATITLLNYTSRQGKFIKIGRFVFLSFEVATSTSNFTYTGSGVVNITGVPYAPDQTTAGAQILVGYQNGGATRQYVTPFCNAGTSVIAMLAVFTNLTDGPGNANVNIANFVSGAGFQISGTIVYTTAN